MSLLLKLDNLIEGEIIKRPSKHIKTPYVADIKMCSTSDMILGHTASLGCCGLADVGASVLMSPVPKTKKIQILINFIANIEFIYQLLERKIQKYLLEYILN